MTEIPDYHHRFHAGNVGDVWKHCVLVAAIEALTAGERPLHLIETHAGEGRYALGPTGEWTEGIGRLRAAPPAATPAVTRFLELVGRLGGPRSYPGSPALALALMRPEDRLTLHELRPEAAVALQRTVDDERVTVVAGDGLAGLAPALAAVPPDAQVLVLVDPPWSTKPEWIAVPDALAAALAAHPHAAALLWYPIKSLTRPNAMLARLAAAGAVGETFELVTTPLDLKRNRLNGSGIAMFRLPPALLSAVAAAAPPLGAACATHDGRWSMRALRFGAPVVAPGAALL